MIAPELALILALVLSVLAFARLRGATALSWSFVVGYLLLPSAAAINFQGFPGLDKYRVIWVGASLGTVAFHTRALATMRWHMADLLVFAGAACAGLSSIDNDLGQWDALSQSASVMLSTGLPYFLGRIHLRTAGDLVGFVKVFFWGAVLYVPLAVWEFRMSPQFHNVVYGYFPHTWLQQVRWGFYRPVIFLGHGLGVAGLFSAGVLVGLVLLRRRLLQWSLPLPVWLAVAGVGVGLAVGMSFGPWFSVGLCGGLFWLARRRRWAPAAAGVPGMVYLVYVLMTGSTMSWMADPLRDLGAGRRADSLQFRLDTMAEHAAVIRTRPWFGHGAWGRGRIQRQRVKIDSVALIYLLQNGVVGAAARYWWMFCVVAAAQRVVWRTPNPAERDILLMLACIIGLRITTSVFGIAVAYVPVELIGGAMTGMAAATSGRRANRRRVVIAPAPTAMGMQTLLQRH